MLYREAGQFKTSYGADTAIFPIRQDGIAMALVVFVAFLAVPLLATPYVFTGILIPFLILSLAALGLNILTGYAGQLSLGSAAFMAVGAFAAYNLMLRVPNLRIKGFYLAVTTLAAQFIIEWALTKFGWFSNYNPSGVISAQKMVILGYRFESPVRRYLLTLALVSLLALAAKNLVRSRVGRAWMAVRDMDVAAEVIGIPMLKTKLTAFAVSSFYC